jgi:hypothetical protein
MTMESSATANNKDIDNDGVDSEPVETNNQTQNPMKTSSRPARTSIVQRMRSSLLGR